MAPAVTPFRAALYAVAVALFAVAYLPDAVNAVRSANYHHFSWRWLGAYTLLCVVWIIYYTEVRIAVHREEANGTPRGDDIRERVFGLVMFESWTAVAFYGMIALFIATMATLKFSREVLHAKRSTTTPDFEMAGRTSTRQA